MQVYNRAITADADGGIGMVPDVPREQVLFVDIETTGLSAERDRIYLVGCGFFQQNRWQLIQWFDETGETESDVLTSFLVFARKYKVLVHYNGDRFDLPFLQKRILSCGLDSTIGGLRILAGMRSVDLYKVVRPYKALLALENLQQQTVESYMGSGRVENTSGGDLIKVYRAYLALTRLPGHDEENPAAMEQVLMGHNAADLRGLLFITPILSLPALLRATPDVYKAQASRYQSFDGTWKEEIVLFCRLRTPLPPSLPSNKESQKSTESQVSQGTRNVAKTDKTDGETAATFSRPLSASRDNCYLHLENGILTLKIPMIHGELKFFYANYQDYYYLPAEDMALHKSIAAFVDKTHRIQATAATCYTRKKGDFLPEWEQFRTPFFKTDYKDKYAWFEFKPEMKKDKPFFCEYAAYVYRHITGVTGGQVQ